MVLRPAHRGHRLAQACHPLHRRRSTNGDGIRWNVGELERVEGYSNFLFVALAAAALRLGLDPMAVLSLTSCIALLACGPLLYGADEFHYWIYERRRSAM
jgi:hypothetical protein